ncbi:MAG: hypothetical protein QXG39_06605 [Candidatus Aenigmatarchaeota archaeon]
MRNPFSRKKEDQEKNSLDILREAFKELNEVPVKNDPTITAVTKVETVKIEQKETPPAPALELPSELITEEELNLVRKLLDVFRGKIEIGNRLRPLLNPENLQTTSRLSESEVDFVTDAHWLANQWKVFEPLRDLANEFAETVISEGGKGRQEAINFVSALTEGRLLKSLTLSTEMPKKSRFSFGKKEKTETEAEGET